MKRIDLDIDKFSNDEVGIVADIFKAGKIGVIPTDTIYGLSALAKDKKAIAGIYKIKKRAKTKPLILLMKSFCMIRKYCYLNTKQYEYIKKELNAKKPLTVILRNKSKEFEYLANENQGLSVRIPQGNSFLMKVIKKINEPIVSTSLNLSGEKAILDLKNLDEKINIRQIDFILDIGKIKKAKASKIVDISNIKSIKLIRK